jgi:hypothetical protein
MAQSGSPAAVDAADLQTIDLARDAELHRILGDEAYRAWLKNNGDGGYRAFQGDPQSVGLDAKRVARIYDVLREYDIAAASMVYEERLREISGQAIDRAASEQDRVTVAKQAEAALSALVGRERFETMQKQALFGLPDQGPPFAADLGADHH